VNTRTSLEVDKSMAITRKDDAKSIVGDELADELEEQAELVGKSDALVIRSDEEEIVEEAKTEEAPGKAEEECKDEVTGQIDPDCVGKKAGETPMDEHPAKRSKVAKQYLTKEDITEIVRSVISDFNLDKEEPATPSHPLDTHFSEFKNKFDAIINSEASEEEKLSQVQEPFNALGTGIVSIVKSSIKSKEITPEVKSQMDIVEALSKVMNPIAQKLDLILAQQSTPQIEKPMPTIPQRRSIPPSVMQKLPQQQINQSETPKLREIINRTT